MSAENVLFVLTDQWPASAFSFCGADIATPNIDRLAAAGTVFRNAFTTCPLCTPARGTLLTGRWPHETGITDNYAVGYSQQFSPPLTERTWIDEAARLGYHVGYFGKWHMGPVNPEARGAHRFDPDAEGQRRPYDPETSNFSYQFAKDNYDRQTQGLIRGRAPFWGDTAQPKEACPPFPVMENGVPLPRRVGGRGPQQTVLSDRLLGGAAFPAPPARAVYWHRAGTPRQGRATGQSER